MVKFVLLRLLEVMGVLMALPLMVALIYREYDSAICFLVLVLVFALTGFLGTLKKPENTVMFAKEGFAITAVAWIFMSLVGAIPFVVTGTIPNYIDACFETVSGFTTTGGSILLAVDGMEKSVQFWRTFTHWIGGMGVLVFLIAVVPMADGYSMHLMRAESPGPVVGKIVPKVRSTAKMLYYIYLAITVLEIVILFACGMPFFDSVCSAFGTAGTGGFAVKNDSFASYAPHLQWIVAFFMLMFGANFNFYYYLTTRQGSKAFKLSEVKVYLAVALVATGIVCFSIFGIYGNLEESLRHSLFQVATCMTTTGFATTDFDLWPGLAKFVLVVLMFIGACASSTGGGIKISRFQIMFKALKREIESYIHPKTVKKIHLDGKTVDSDVERSVALYFFIYLIVFVFSMLIVAIEGHDLVTVFTSVAATLNNIGPGLSLVGPTRNYSFFSDLTKWVLIFDMIAGRLELIPVLVFLNPFTYKGIIKKVPGIK